MRTGLLLFVVLSAVVAACAHAPPPLPSPPPPPKPKLTLAVLPAESDAFPKAAAVATGELAKAHLLGIDETKLSSVSLEIVQLSIECVEATNACYQAVGKSLAANRILFAQIAKDKKAAAKQSPLRVTITMFDVDAQVPKRVERAFADEQSATAGIADMVGEATR